MSTGEQFDAIIIGAGAAGLFCAAQAGQRGLRVLLLDNGKKPGRKILMSGGGRCNFTNLHVEPAAFLSQNPHFCKSALSRYSQWDFIELVRRHRIAFHEKTLGQLFCDDSAQQIVTLLLDECQRGGVTLRMRSEVAAVEKRGLEKRSEQFHVLLPGGEVTAPSLVVATGGLSMPGLGATPLGYRIAERFGIPVVPTRAALVPFTLHKPLLESLGALAGVALPTQVEAAAGMSFRENLLFTHRGLSGPAMLQISSYWQNGEFLTLNLVPERDLEAFLTEERRDHPNQTLKNTLAKVLPRRFVECWHTLLNIPECTLTQLSRRQQNDWVMSLRQWRVQPNGTEGYRTAEVTQGGVDTRRLSSKTMESRQVPGLYFIGEVVDVTGWLGGYNFQWAWSSAWACGQALAEVGGL